MRNFDTTQPLGDSDPGRPSSFIRHLGGLVREPDGGISRLSTLSPSLMQDLLRFEQPGRPAEMLEVVAASLRHGRPLTVHLRCQVGLTELTILPLDRQVLCQIPMAQFLALQLTDLEVMLVEPTAGPAPATDAAPQPIAPLGPLTWELALRGARGDLLPEIPRRAAFRIPPGAELRTLDLTGTLGEAVKRLRRRTTNLRAISSWPGFDRERAMRLLNALYLQAALMISRSHPAATNDDWSD